MKIGILGSRGIPNEYGGFEQFAQYLSVGLADKGWEVWVYCSSSHPYQKDRWHGVNLIRCYDPEDKIGTAGQFIYDLNCIRDSRKRDFDIIYQLGYTSNSVWYRLLPDEPVIVTNMDGLEWKRSKYSHRVRKFLKYAEKLAVKSSDLLVADSEAIQKYLKHEYKSNAEFLPYGADFFYHPEPEQIKEYGVQPYGYYLLIARMQADNHIEEIIRGVLKSNSDKPLVVVGSVKNEFGKYLKKTYECEKILFQDGMFDAFRLNQLRYHSALYFHGHSAGGTNPSLLEAMASSALICAHDNDFNRAVLQQNAWYFFDENDVSEILNSGVENTKNHHFVCENLNIIKDKYNWTKIIDNYNKLFMKII